ncbi:CBS domain-containing protein [Rhodoblastus acidophilus]|uniref:CBS domain-containing protein n=1 Tax=Candidatus Rhodoblastus alkanivorans TaxID=2954117 RepID=A0ABS9Z632_9HYPH|nr:CBS domain-containing protein [Candidatus Rhodoblastus alkanivorans]MCI4677722.1 CBS domain-containing protein [Candidatus Rhodoblastus alkanivorans]MCI4682546.1 CBS domain-containing protein [Candidatus Rhodoblastus alkanivorans]MDI4639852.1 CBS domain-containing protein [Rhodoblastus acidophilus]
MLDIVGSSGEKRARDVMTSPVSGVGPDESARAAAETMLRLGVSGLPVLDPQGRPLGVVSEGDFRFADSAMHKKLREDWVNLLAGGQDMAANYLDALEREADKVRQIMAKPALCVDEDASVADVADLMSAHRVKRIFVLRDGIVVGVVTRADLLRLFAPEERPQARPVTPEVFDAARQRAQARLKKLKAEKAPPPEPEIPAGGVTAAELKAMVGEFERAKAQVQHDAIRQAHEKRGELVKELLTARYDDKEMAQLMMLAREAARRGETGVVALTFPAALCDDGGRAINLPDRDWPASLRGKAADFFLRWDKELRPLGFALSARIANFPDGFPGDAELTLVWGS